MQLTARDKRILEAIQAFDGMVSLKQIDRLFFSGKGRTQPRARMRLLFDNAYVNMPDVDTVHQVPCTETIYWLDTKGAAVVAGLQGITPKTLPWRKKPRFSLVAHDLAVNDFRIDVMQAAAAARTLSLYHWVPEGEFWAHPDKVTYTTRTDASRSRRVRPDGFFTIRRTAAHQPSKLEQFAFLLEIDMSTEHNPRFAREKVRPGVAYLRSVSYKQRFGLRYGRWLVVTTSKRRRENMKAQTERAGGEGLFYFTTFDDVRPETVLKEPIWWMAGENTPRPIIPAGFAAG